MPGLGKSGTWRMCALRSKPLLSPGLLLDVEPMVRARGRLGVVDGHRGDARPAGTLPQRALHACHRFVVAFHHRLDAPVGQVAYPPRDALAVGDVLREIAEPDALHAAADKVSPSHTH